ncbi:MAG: hypothetical protein ACTSRE_14590 [Promethearchaeota archaeon]
MTDTTHETMIPRHKENMVSQAVGNLIVIGSFELIIGIFLYVFAYIVLNDLQVDALPPFTVNNFPVMRGIAITLIVIGGVHFLFSIAFNWCYKFKTFRIIGYVLGFFALPVIPTGTFFGMLVIAEMKRIRTSENPLAVDIREYDKNEIGIEIKTNALVMAHLPLILYYVYRYLLTIQTDIMYPLFRMDVIIAFKVFAFVYSGIFILEVVVGIVFRFYGEKNWEQIILVAFSIFNIICLAIVLQTYFWLNWEAFEFEGIMKVLGNLVWVIGIVMNPIGIFFAAHFFKLLNQSHVYHSRTIKDKRKK